MKSRLLLLHLVVSFILLGAYAISAQVLFIREFLVVFYGNELCIGVLFAVWLAGITLGAFIGSRIIGRVKERTRFFLILQAVMCLLLPSQLYLARITGTLFEVPPGEYLPFTHMMYGAFLCILPLSSVIGCSFPFACRIFIRKGTKESTRIGWVYVLESAGSMLGGAAMTFYFIVRFHPFHICMILCLTLLANCFMLSLLSPSKRTRFSLGALFFCIFMVCGFLMLSMNMEKMESSSVEMRWKALNRGSDLLESIDSRYQNLAVGHGNGQYSVFGNGQYITAFPDEYGSAVFAHFILSEHPRPEKVLLVGGGTSGVIREMLKHQISVLHYVELDPELMRIIMKYLPSEDKKALDDEKVEVFYTDGRYFVKNSSEKYDVIVLNLPDPSTAMLNRFYTVDFFKEVKTILKRDGVLVTGVSSSMNYIGREIGDYSGSVYHSLLRVFSFVLATPGEKNYFFATESPGVITSDVGILSARYAERQIESDYFSTYHFSLLLPPDRVRFIESSLRESASLPINTDLKPITYFYNLILWNIFSAERGGLSLFKLLRRLNLWWFISPLILFLIVQTVYALSKEDRRETTLRFNCLSAITTTGFAGMSLEIILVFAFQNVYGYIYQMIGLIIAVFMAGLTLGGWIMSRMIQTESGRWVTVLTAIEIFFALGTFSLPYIIDDVFSLMTRDIVLPLHSEYFFMSLIGVIGMLTGSEFPLVSEILIKGKKEPGRVAGVVDSFDHMGAFLGAFVTGAILVPLLGIKETCFLIGAFKAVSVILLITYLLRFLHGKDCAA